MWSSLVCKISESTKWLSSGGSGSMGFGLPSAIGAAFANPDSCIICISGDGGIQMNIQELQTIKENNLNIKICILNNSFLGMVRQWQELFYDNNYSHVSIGSPNFEKLAESYEIEAQTISNKNDLKQLHNIITKNNNPYVINFHVEKEDNVFPMVPGGYTLGEVITNND